MRPTAPTALKPLARLGHTAFLHDGGLLNLALSADGRTLRTLAHHGLEAIITDWDAEDGSQRAQSRMRRRERFARCAGAMSSTGALVACADAPRDGRRFCVDLWTPNADGKTLRIEPPGDAEAIGELAFTADGAGLLRAHLAGVERWRVATGELDWRVEVPALGPVWPGSTLARNGARFVSAFAHEGASRVELRDVLDARLVSAFTLDLRDARRLCLSRDGRRLAARTAPETVTVFDLENGATLARLTLPAVTQATPSDGLPELGAWAFTPDGEALLIAVRTHYRTPSVLTRYELPEGRVRWRSTGPFAWGFDFCPRGTCVLAAGGRRVRRLALDTGAPRSENLAPHAEARQLAVTADGRRAVTVSDAQAHSDRLASLWDVASGRVVRELAASELAASDDGGVIALDGDPVALLDPHAATLRTIAPGPVTALGLAPDGGALMTVSSIDDYRGRVVTRYATDTGLELRCDRYYGQTTALDSVALSPDGRRVATTALGASVVHLRQRDDLTARAPLKGHRKHPTCIRFSPDGHALASGDPSGRVIVWDVEGAAMRATHELGAPVRAIAFAPGGAVLAVTGGPTITLLSVADGAVTARLAVEHGGACALAFAADGRLFVAHADTTLGVYDATALA
ncbi:MAG: WD40 repeat domain-containing protein [Polyangiales bacterium]